MKLTQTQIKVFYLSLCFCAQSTQANINYRGKVAINKINMNLETQVKGLGDGYNTLLDQVKGASGAEDQGLEDLGPFEKTQKMALKKAPGVVYVDPEDNFKIKSQSTALEVTEADAIPGTDIYLIFAHEIDANSITNNGSIFEPVIGEMLSMVLFSTDPSENMETKLTINHSLNRGLQEVTNLSDGSSGDYNAIPNNATWYDNFIDVNENRIHLKTSQGILGAAADELAQRSKTITLNEKARDDNYYIISMNSPSDNNFKNISKGIDLGTAEGFIEANSLDYYAVSLGGGIDVGVTPFSQLSLDFTLDAPIQKVEQDAIYYEIDPEIALQADVGIKIGDPKNNLGIHSGKRLTRFSSEYRAISDTEAAVELVSTKNKKMEHILQAYISVSANIELMPYVQGHVNFQINEKQESIMIDGNTTPLSMTSQHVSFGITGIY
ncbi:hypothetical protein MMH89_01070 [Candidatus Comchoanobacter bicostacola]|uniref:Uncharacterized protein n=1 Tax=Candidatus Comchoanobacter bicostacola TaxID=2919598 RepID=A0ABY5DM37_9GAMM|nr:hypothetical protein [Candidatus Comchoanobacter bicostacola]UTC24747.1 hypothetical protein MMH89_01070 [Candidatus Comchoanobacter bicostacola]